MKKICKNGFQKSFFCALRGLNYVVKNERNFRIELIVTIFVLFFAILLNIQLWELIIVIFLIGFVLIAELANTVMERVVDILEPRVHPYARLIKDIMASIVLMAALMALVIGLLIFSPYFFNLNKISL